MACPIVELFVFFNIAVVVVSNGDVSRLSDCVELNSVDPLKNRRAAGRILETMLLGCEPNVPGRADRSKRTEASSLCLIHMWHSQTFSVNGISLCSLDCQHRFAKNKPKNEDDVIYLHSIAKILLPVQYQSKQK